MVARLGLSSHTITIERVKAGKFSDLASGGSVLPEEAVRYSAHFGIQFQSAWVKMWVTNLEGGTVWGPEEANANLGGNAWLDKNAPITPGLYTLHIEATESIYGFRQRKHTSTRTFRVDPGAPPPPGGGVFPALPGIGGLLTNPWALVVIFGALIVLGVLI